MDAIKEFCAILDNAETGDGLRRAKLIANAVIAAPGIAIFGAAAITSLPFGVNAAALGFAAGLGAAASYLAVNKVTGPIAKEVLAWPRRRSRFLVQNAARSQQPELERFAQFILAESEKDAQLMVEAEKVMENELPGTQEWRGKYLTPKEFENVRADVERRLRKAGKWPRNDSASSVAARVAKTLSEPERAKRPPEIPAELRTPPVVIAQAEGLAGRRATGLTSTASTRRL